MKVLFASVEVAPFAWAGGMGDVAGSLPKALRDLGVDIRVIMPKHRGCAERAEGLRRVVDACPVHMPFWVSGCAVDETRLPGSQVPLYLVEHQQYFDREFLYGPPGASYADNLTRFSFFCRAVVESLQGLRWRPDIIHLNDWHTALLALYARSWGLDFRTVYTAHQLEPAFHGVFPAGYQTLAGIDLGLPEARQFVREGWIDLARAGLALADAANTVSPTYAREVAAPDSESGVADLVARLGDRFCGILNGIDYSRWSPLSDEAIAARYDSSDLSGKAMCKADLQRLAGLREDRRAPLVGMVTRLDPLKGFDLIEQALPRITGAQLVFLGTGDPRYMELLRQAAAARDDVAAFLQFDPVLARKVYAGADIFLMPSRREPAGLAQMIAMAYGAVPVVHQTGGLADTVTESPSERNGFVFETYTAEDLLAALSRALETFRSRKAWSAIMARGMARDFSWGASAREYLKLYERTVQGGASRVAC